MLLRVIKERWNEDGTPMIDPQSGAARIQLINGGHIRVLNPATSQVDKYKPGDVFEVPEHVAREILFNSPQAVEPEAMHQARLAARRQREAARVSDLDALDARIREQSRDTEQVQKLNAMIDERERSRAAENLRVAQAAKEESAKDSIIAEMRQRMSNYEAMIADLAAKLTAPAAPASPPAEPIDPPAEKSTRKKAGG